MEIVWQDPNQIFSGHRRLANTVRDVFEVYTDGQKTETLQPGRQFLGCEYSYEVEVELKGATFAIVSSWHSIFRWGEAYDDGASSEGGEVIYTLLDDPMDCPEILAIFKTQQIEL